MPRQGNTSGPGRRCRSRKIPRTRHGEAARRQPRKLLLQRNRNGFYYVLDRTNGEFLLGTPFVDKLDWATGLDAKGHPIVTPGHYPTVKGTTTCPSTMGATKWPPPTYSPDTRYLYVV